MIRGAHTKLYTPKPEVPRACFRDAIGFPRPDLGEGGLSFDLPEADLGRRPSED